MTIYVWTIDQYIAWLEDIKKDGFKHIIHAVKPFHGTNTAPSKRVPLFRLSMALPEEIVLEEYRNDLGSVIRDMIPCLCVVVKPEKEYKINWPDDKDEIKED